MLNRLQDVFSSFQKYEVRYLVIGGLAAVLHGVPRTTFDLDILIDATPDNARRLLAAMLDAGLGTAALTSPDALLAHVVTIFKDRVRIDVRPSTLGLTFEDAWQRRERMCFRGQEFLVVCKADLIASKKAAGRPKDIEDVRLLELPPRPEGESRS